MSAADGIEALAASVRSGERLARDVVEDCLARIEERDPDIGAFEEVYPERALDRADALDASLARGADPGPLCGVPLALKGNMCLEGIVATCGSRMLAGYRPPYTATFVQRALDAGAIPIGTTHMDEFAMGSSGENSAFGTSRNPWDTTRTPGGSSSGCAAAVAAGMVPAALGSDTGGSVRQPAALCGITGFKPSYGRISRYGLIAFASSLDQVSPMARSVRDVELLFTAVAGGDPFDATTIDAGPPRLADEDRGIEGLVLGVPAEWLPEELDRGVRERVEQALAVLAELGATVRSVSLASSALALPTYYVVAAAEASSNLARFDGVRYGLRESGVGTLDGMMSATRAAGFGDEVKRRILLGTYVLASGYYDAWYGRALKARGLLDAELRAAFGQVDLLCGPTSPTPAFSLGERDDPLAMYLADVLTVPASLAGLPAISVPCGTTGGDGPALPVGLQIVGPREADSEVLRAARVFQEATLHHLETPPAFP